MSECTQPGCPGTVREGFCDYCGFAPGPPKTKGDSIGSSRVAPITVSDSAPTTGHGRAVAHNALEMAGVPVVPYRDPKQAIMLDPAPAAGERSFTPELRPGELVSGQYEVQGCLDRGGLGWIYLAYDNNVGHWVVLKGLLDTGDAADHRLPAAERAALAAVNHPNIVKIHNFVRHPVMGPRPAHSYIVMEYVGGRSLKQLLDEQPRDEGPPVLPVDHVIAYGIEMLRALDYLHGRGLLYCDLKPANVMQCEQWLTLIDLGAARRMKATGGPIMWTPGYGAPEVETEGPSISSDIYTVGRTMAALSLPIRGFTDTWATSLPPRDEVPQLTEFESYDRLLRRATHPDPGQRFRDAAEMIEQLYGVLREVVAAPRNAEPWPVPSTLFGQERQAVGTEVIAADGEGGAPDRGQSGGEKHSVLGYLDPAAAVAALPVPIAPPADDNADLAALAERAPEEIVDTLTNLAERAPEEPEEPEEIVDKPTNQPEPPTQSPPESSPEVKLVLAGALLDLGDGDRAGVLLQELAEALPGDWRVDWYQGVAALTAGRWDKAQEVFDALYTRMPGEAAPKLALAFCCEGIGDREEAARRYESVWRTDRGYVSAAFGLARVRLRMGDRAGAMRALDDVSSLSRHYGVAQLAAMGVAVRGRPADELSEKDLLSAQQRLDESRVVDSVRRNQLVAELLEAGLDWLRAGNTARPDARLHDVPLTEDGLRPELERTYRMLGRLAEDADAKHALVAKANAIRPWTLV